MAEATQDIDQLNFSFNKTSDRYDSLTNTFHHRIAEHVILHNMLQTVALQENRLILDSGGGTGKIAFELAKRGYRVCLSDISEKSVALAAAKFKVAGLDVQAFVRDSENTGFDRASFDIVMLNGGVINYTPSPENLLKESNRILKPNGKLWFDFLNPMGWAIECVDPRQKAMFAAIREKKIQMPDWDYPVRFISMERVEELMHSAGFNVISKFGLINLSHSLPLEFRYSNSFDDAVLAEYREIELALSRKENCIGSAWSCIVYAQKVS